MTNREPWHSPYPYKGKPATDIVIRIERSCLRCSTAFIADGKYQRMCRWCRENA